MGTKKGMEKRLADAICSCHSSDADYIAKQLIKKGWRDTEKRPRVQQVTVVPNQVLQAMQPQTTQLPDHRSLPVDFKNTRFLK